jgi:elongation factor G
MAFQIAGSMGFKAAVAKANPKLLEPVMSLEVVTPSEYMGDVIGQIQQRRARIEEINSRSDETRIIQALAPLGEMFGYATHLRSATQGRATYTMQFDHYEEAPREIVDGIIGTKRRR